MNILQDIKPVTYLFGFTSKYRGHPFEKAYGFEDMKSPVM